MKIELVVWILHSSANTQSRLSEYLFKLLFEDGLGED